MTTSMQEQIYKNEGVSRRGFLKMMGVGAATMALASCGVKKEQETTVKRGEGTMTYRTNPNTGDVVSLLGYGMMRLPTIQVGDAENPRQEIDQESVNELVDYAIEHGINYFDTSPAYCQGRSETATGIALSRHPRDKYFIATKMSNFSPDTWPREKSIEMFEHSLQALQTDYIDYMLLHSVGGGGMDNFNTRYIDNGILDYLQEQKEQGRIRNLGFSYHGDIEVFDTLLRWKDEGRLHWDFVQIQLNYVDWKHAKQANPRNTDAEYLYGELVRRDIPAVIMEPLLGGRLANVSSPIAAKMKQRRPDDSVASWAFRYAGTPADVLTVLSGMTYMEHLQENLATYSPLELITADEDEFLQRIALEYLDNKIIICNTCDYCMPCPYGLDIPGIFTHYNKCINNDNVPRDTRDPRYAAARRAFLVGYDRAIDKSRQADRCLSCGECVTHCPQSIDIPKELRLIADYTQALRRGKA